MLLVLLFILHALNFVLFLFLLVSGIGCDLCMWHSLDFSINFLLSHHMCTFLKHPSRSFQFARIMLHQVLEKVYQNIFKVLIYHLKLKFHKILSYISKILTRVFVHQSILLLKARNYFQLFCEKEELMHNNLTHV